MTTILSYFIKTIIQEVASRYVSNTDKLSVNQVVYLYSRFTDILFDTNDELCCL